MLLPHLQLAHSLFQPFHSEFKHGEDILNHVDRVGPFRAIPVSGGYGVQPDRMAEMGSNTAQPGNSRLFVMIIPVDCATSHEQLAWGHTGISQENSLVVRPQHAQEIFRAQRAVDAAS